MSYKSPVARLYRCDALALLKAKKDNSIDLIATDPAYPSLEKHRAHGTTTRLSHSKGSDMDWFPCVTNEYLREWFRECLRVLKPGRHAYVMANHEQHYISRSMGIKAGFQFRRAIIWNKVAIGMSQPRCQYEVVLYFNKPGKYYRPRDLSIGDFLTFDPDLGMRYSLGKEEDDGLDTITVKRLKAKPKKTAKSRPNVYPTEKPVALMELLIKQGSTPGERVLDSFVGGGAATAVAAIKNDRIFLGSELHPPMYHEAVRRIQAAECEFDKGTPEDDEEVEADDAA